MAISVDPWTDLLTNKKTFAHIATLMPDGTPQVTPVWIDYKNGKVLEDWGLHLIDVNLAMGNLLTIVGEETKSLQARIGACLATGRRAALNGVAAALLQQSSSHDRKRSTRCPDIA